MHQKSKMLYHAEKDGLRIVEDKIGIHVVETIIDEKRPTLLYLPGLSGEAVEGFKCLAPCLDKGFNVASMSFRGRGRSSTPDKGYSLGDHVDDLGLVIEHLDAKKLIIVATSISAIYVAKYFIDQGKNETDGMVIVDHPLRVNKLKHGWAEEFSKISVNGVPVTKTMRKSALDAIERESEDYDVYFEYMDLELPTLVMYPTVPKGLIEEKDIERYQQQDRTRLVEFQDSDHFIRLREPEKFLNEIVQFSGAILK